MCCLYAGEESGSAHYRSLPFINLLGKGLDIGHVSSASRAKRNNYFASSCSDAGACILYNLFKSSIHPPVLSVRAR